MKTANQYIEEIKAAMDNHDPAEAINIFHTMTEMAINAGNQDLILEVHKAVGPQIVEAAASPGYREEMERQAEEREKARREEEDRIGVWRLSRWPELRNAGILEEGDLVQISIEDNSGMMTINEMTMRVMHVDDMWEGTFTKKRNGKFKLERSHTGLIFFEGKAMYIERGDDEPMPIFPDSTRKFKYCTISVVSKAGA